MMGGLGSAPRDESGRQLRRPYFRGHAALFTHKRVVSVDLACKSRPARRDIS